MSSRLGRVPHRLRHAAEGSLPDSTTEEFAAAPLPVPRFPTKFAKLQIYGLSGRHSSQSKPVGTNHRHGVPDMSSPAATQVIEVENYINGTWRRATSTEFLDVTNPATGEVIARTPVSTKADLDAAVQAAAEAFPAWRRTPAGERIQYLFKLKFILEDHIDELARLITLENGKTFAEAKAELRRSIENVEVACGIPTMMQGYNLEDITPGVDETLIRQPLGVVAAITAFNFPAMIP